MVQQNRRGNTTRRATNLELHRMAQAHTDNELRLILWAEQGFVIAVPRDARVSAGVPVQIHSRWHIPSCTPVRQEECDPAPQTNNSIPDGAISLWSDCCSMSIRTRTQTVVPWPHRTRRWSRLAGNLRALASPCSTQIPDCAVSHTLSQSMDCLISTPRPGDTNWISGASGWADGVTAPPTDLLVPVPDCLPG